MKIIVTPRELLDTYKWDQFCELRGWSVWCLNEGLISSSEEIILTSKEAYVLGYQSDYKETLVKNKSTKVNIISE